MQVQQPVSILLVDDHARNLVALEAALASVDCSAVTSDSGRDALRCLLTQDFAVILIDIHMPEMDGFETASLIRARERSHSTPIVFLTADDRAEARLLDGYRLGAADYIHKSLDPDMLRSKVSFFVDLFRKTVALEQRTAELSTMAAELEYGATPNYGLSTLLRRSSPGVQDMLLSDLEPQTAYVNSWDNAGFLGASDDFTFSTAPAPLSALLGDTAVETERVSLAAGEAAAYQYVAAQSGQANLMRLFVDRGSTAPLISVALYSDQDGAPGAILAQGSVPGPTVGSVRLGAAA